MQMDMQETVVLSCLNKCWSDYNPVLESCNRITESLAFHRWTPYISESLTNRIHKFITYATFLNLSIYSLFLLINICKRIWPDGSRYLKIMNFLHKYAFA